jgi:hypothetical protein
MRGLVADRDHAPWADVAAAIAVEAAPEFDFLAKLVQASEDSHD